MPPINWGDVQYDKSYLILKWGENPYPPPNNVVSSISKSLWTINRYPTLMMKLKRLLANYCRIDVNNITLTNGLDKAFRLLAECFIDEGDEVIFFYPSYPEIISATELLGGKLIKIPLSKGFIIPSISKIKQKITSKTKLIYICNPNNPTGNFMATTKQIKDILELNNIVVVDEAYYEFSGQTCLDLLKKYNNLIVLRSFSKTFGLAGLRVGYIFAEKNITKHLLKVEETIEIFNISTPSLAGAISALESRNYFISNIKKINKTKENLIRKLQQLGIKTYKSFTSFVLFNLEPLKISSKDFVNRMLAEKIVVKDCSIYEGLGEYDAYITVPKADDLPRVINSITKILR